MQRGRNDSKINSIAAAVNKHRFESHSLLSGLMGRALFNANLALDGRFSGQHSEDDLISDLLKITSFENYDNCSYSSGVSGCLWLVGHFHRRGYLNRSEVIDGQVYEAFYGQAMEMLRAGNYDPLHGAIGQIHFALESEVIEQPLLLSQFIEELAARAIVDEKGARWRYRSACASEESKDKLVINLGMAHGQSGIMAFLLRCKSRGHNSRTLDTLLYQAAQFLVHSVMEFNEGATGIQIPAIISDGHYGVGRKLTWCFGDLSSAYTLHKVATLLNHSDWQHLALAILERCASPNYVEALPMKDASFCHGTAGTSYLFGKLYQELGLIEFKAARDKWLEETLDFAGNDDRAAAYQFFNGREYETVFGLLEGLSGIGLVLLAHLRGFDRESTDWDSCLYLS